MTENVYFLKTYQPDCTLISCKRSKISVSLLWQPESLHTKSFGAFMRTYEDTHTHTHTIVAFCFFTFSNSPVKTVYNFTFYLNYKDLVYLHPQDK